LRELVVASVTSSGQILPSASQVRFVSTGAKNIEGSKAEFWTAESTSLDPIRTETASTGGVLA
jgi:hypothetical protein